MKMSHETDRIPEPYTPTPDGFERRLRAWVRLPMDDVAASGAGGASASPKDRDVRDQTGRMTPRRKNHRRRRGGRSDA
jgi:hypothetical protein